MFSQLSRSEWERIFDGTDACCVPVLTRDESALQVLPASKQENIESGEFIIPPPAPKLLRTPGRIPDGSPEKSGESAEILLTPGDHSLEVLREFGLKEDEIVKLWREGAVDGSDAPEGGERSKL